ncbi:MAG: hypothetical protein LBQ50_06265 [Planctomycetaceae bacterium]|nr:hypothetical protein [Planctomycetaceae bacterium]
MKRILFFTSNYWTIFGLCAVIVLVPRSVLFGQIIQMGGLPRSNATSIYQSVYNSDTPKAPVRQMQHLFQTVSENEPIEPMPLAANQSGLAAMTRRSNRVVPLPPSTNVTPTTTEPTMADSAAENSIFGQYSQPQPQPLVSLASPSFLLASHPQETAQAPQIQFSTPVLPETTTVQPIPSTVPAVTAPVATVPAVTVPAVTVPAAPIATLPTAPAPSPPSPTISQPPQAVPVTPTRLIATEAVTKNHRLQNVHSEIFEQKLVEKLGKRFVPVRNVEASLNLSRFRLPVKDGTDVELSIDRQNGIITVIGSAPMVESCLRIVRLLDSQENMEFIPVQRSNLAAFRQAAQVVNRETQKLAQNSPTFQRNGDQPSANFVAPNSGQLPNGNGNAGAGVVGPVQIDIIEGIDEMVIRGTPSDVAAIREILRQIEAMSLEHEPVIELVAMQHADSYRISQMVQQLYSQVYLARKGSITMLPLIKPNTILMIGKQESINTAKELIAKLDTPVAPESEFQIFRLKNASSDTLQTQIAQFYASRIGVNQGLETQVNVVSDARTNSLIVQANPRDMVEIATMILQLDAEGSDATNIVKTFPLKNAMASELATTLQNAITGTTTATGGGFGGGAGAAQNSRTRNPMVTTGIIDRDGNLQRVNILYDVRVVADTRSNTLIVTAPEKSMSLIEALVKQLDQLPSAESQIKVFTLVNGDAYTLTTMLTNLFASSTTGGGGFGGGGTQTNQLATVRPGIEEGESTLVSVRFQTDTRTNSIIACGTAGDMAVVEALLLRLDEENMNNRKVMVLKLVNIPVSQVATAIQDYVTNERQIEIQNSSSYYPQSPREQYLKEVVVVPEAISNTLIVSTTPRYYAQIRKIVHELDERPFMVAIQVLIAEVSLENNKELGIELGLQDSLLFDRSLLSSGAPSPGFLFSNPTLGLPLGNVNSGTVGTQGITSLGVNRARTDGIGGFTFSASSESVSVLIRALEQQRKLRVLSRPQITAMHNVEATLQVGQKVPYITDVNSSYNTMTSSTDYLDVGVILDVTPRITADGMIVMNIYTEKSKVGSEADGIPIYSSGTSVIRSPKVDITKAQTTVSAMDGQTIIFAGLITEEKETLTRSVPYLNKIPVIKHLFEYNTTTCNRNELLIVMTPTIIRSEMDLEVLRQQETSRMHWCINDVIRITGNSRMRLRSDEWSPNEVPYIRAEPVRLDETQLPSEEKVKQVMPFPTLAPDNSN